jgi:hypothetical protein
LNDAELEKVMERMPLDEVADVDQDYPGIINDNEFPPSINNADAELPPNHIFDQVNLTATSTHDLKFHAANIL